MTIKNNESLMVRLAPSGLAHHWVLLLVVLLGLALSNTAQADPVMIKAYREAFPDAHLKCISCHVSALPRKAEGQHEWNAYGLAVRKAAKAAKIPDVPTMDDVGKIIPLFKQIGRIEDFNASISLSINTERSRSVKEK